MCNIGIHKNCKICKENNEPKGVKSGVKIFFLQDKLPSQKILLYRIFSGHFAHKESSHLQLAIDGCAVISIYYNANTSRIVKPTKWKKPEQEEENDDKMCSLGNVIIIEASSTRVQEVTTTYAMASQPQLPKADRGAS